MTESVIAAAPQPSPPTPVRGPRPGSGPRTDLLVRPPQTEPPATMFPDIPPASATAAPMPPPPQPAPAAPPPQPVPAPTAALRRRIETVLRISLEVIDRRRRPDQLRGTATESVISTLSALALSGPPGHELGSARLRRMHIFAVGPTAVEVSANYRRGPRVLAVAGRWELRRRVWICTSLVLA